MKRPLLVTPFAIWIKPGLRIRYRDINHYVEHEQDAQGRTRIEIIDEHYRSVWTRLNPQQYKRFTRFCP